MEPDDIGGAGRLTFDEMQRVDAALRLVLGLRRQSLIGTGWNALRQSCTYAVTANARWMSVECAAAHWFWMTAGSLLRRGWFACGPSSGSAECSGGYAGECVAPLCLRTIRRQTPITTEWGMLKKLVCRPVATAEG